MAAMVTHNMNIHNATELHLEKWVSCQDFILWIFACFQKTNAHLALRRSTTYCLQGTNINETEGMQTEGEMRKDNPDQQKQKPAGAAIFVSDIRTQDRDVMSDKGDLITLLAGMIRLADVTNGDSSKRLCWLLIAGKGMWKKISRPGRLARPGDSEHKRPCQPEIEV